MIVQDRRDYIFKNISICEEGCTAKEVNYGTEEVNCECTPKTGGVLSIIENNEILNTFTSLVNNFNLYLFLCYNIISFNSLLDNYGSWIILSEVIFIVILFICFFICQIKLLNSALNKYLPSPPSNINEKSVEISEKKQIITNQKDQVKDFQKEPILIEELNELNYEEAIVEDKRSFPKFYLSLVLDKQIILSTIVNKSPFYPLSLRLIMLLFTLMTFFFFNAFFFTEDYISQRYNSDSDFDIIFIINNELEKTIYSSVVCLFISKIMFLLTSFHSKFFQIMKDKEISNCEEALYSLIFSYKCKVKVFIVIISLLSCIYWYFLMIFCSVYKSIQIGWIESSLVSISFNMIFPIVLCFGAGIIKFCGIKYKKKYSFLLVIV